jgi:hypothetical protein
MFARRWLIPLFLLSMVAFGAEKQRDWQTGKVLDTERQRYFATGKAS